MCMFRPSRKGYLKLFFTLFFQTIIQLHLHYIVSVYVEQSNEAGNVWVLEDKEKEAMDATTEGIEESISEEETKHVYGATLAPRMLRP